MNNLNKISNLFMDKFFKKEVKISSSEKTEIPSDVQIEIKEKKPEENEIKVTEVSENSAIPSADLNVPINVPINTQLPHEQREVEKKVENPPLTWKEMKSLMSADYEEKIAHNPKFKKVYLIQNRKTKQIAEIRAASSFHACNLIGWRKNKVVLLGERLAEELKPETQNSSSNGTK